MVRAAAELIRTKGVSGTGMREIVQVANAPRGSLQSYFPGGKDQLVSEALRWMGGVAAHRVLRVAAHIDPRTPGALFAGTVDLWRQEFLTSGFGGGCPLVGAAADVASTSESLRTVISDGFDGWQRPLEEVLQSMRVPKQRSATLAMVMLSALEGAIVLSRVRRSVEPLDAVAQELAPFLDAAIPKGTQH